MLLKPFIVSILKIALIFPRISIPYFDNLNYNQRLEGRTLYLTLKMGVVKDMSYSLALKKNKIEVHVDKRFRSLALRVADRGTYVERIDRVLSWVRRNIKYDGNDREDDPVKILRRRRGSCIGFSVLSATLLNSIKIPTKVATGYIIKEGKPVPHRWIEVYFPGQGWVFLDPQRDVESPDYIFMGYNGLSTWPVFSLKTLEVKREVRN